MARTREQTSLERDASELHRAVSELVRVYQFRDRRRICYYDVSVTQCYAIAALVTQGAMQLNQLASQLYLDKSTASRVVDALVRKGYASRRTDPQDARAVRLEVTDRGLALHRQIESDLLNEMEELAADYDPQVRRSTAELIAGLARAATCRFARLATGDGD